MSSLYITFKRPVPDPPFMILTLEEWFTDGKYISALPEVPVYPNTETQIFMESAWSEIWPWGYESEIRCHRKSEGELVTVHVKIPDYDSGVGHALAARLRGFIQSELEIIQDGY